MQCVMNLTIQFFLVYLLLWVFVTTKQCDKAKFATQFLYTI